MPSARYALAESPTFSKGSTASTLTPVPPVSVEPWDRRQANRTPRPSRKPSASVMASTGAPRRVRLPVDEAAGAAATCAVGTGWAAGVGTVGAAVDPVTDA